MIDYGSTSRANLKRFGLQNGSDDTTVITAAMASGAMAIEIPYQSGAPWHTQPITWTTKRRLMMQDGAHLKASTAGYGATDKNLISANLLDQIQFLGFDSILEMRRESLSVDADGPHCLNLRGCTNVSVEGLVFNNGSGDGIHLGPDTTGSRIDCANVNIKRCLFYRNRRQGISITGCEGILVEDCIFRETGTTVDGVAGASPKAGIDIEASQPDSLEDVIVRGCLAENNDQTGFMVNLSAHTSASPAVSILVEQCTARGGNFGIRAVSKAASSSGNTGTITFRDMVIQNTAWQGIWIDIDPGRAHRWQFTNCLINLCATSTSNPLVIDVTDEAAVTSTGGVDFDNVTIIDNQNRDPVVVNYTAGDQADDSTARIRGNIRVINPLLTPGVFDAGAANLTVTVVSSLS